MTPGLEKIVTYSLSYKQQQIDVWNAKTGKLESSVKVIHEALKFIIVLQLGLCSCGVVVCGRWCIVEVCSNY